VALLGLLVTVFFDLLTCRFFHVPRLGGQFGRNPTLCECKAALPL
jgi:hypothetical protein